MIGMHITFKLFASLTDYLPGGLRGNELTLEVPEGSTVTDVVERYQLPARMVHLVLIDGVFVPPAQRAKRVLRAGEVLAIWPPVAGG